LSLSLRFGSAVYPDMNNIAPRLSSTHRHAEADAFEDIDDASQAPIKPLSRAQAQALLAALPKTPYRRVIVAQCVVGLVGAVGAYVITGRQMAAWSALAGGLIAAVPAMLMLYGVTRSPLRHSIIGPMVWLLVKLAATLVMFMLVIRALGKPEWAVMLITLIVALKMYWIVALSAKRSPKKN
jgi:ATP synthase protein I